MNKSQVAELPTAGSNLEYPKQLDIKLNCVSLLQVELLFFSLTLQAQKKWFSYSEILKIEEDDILANVFNVNTNQIVLLNVYHDLMTIYSHNLSLKVIFLVQSFLGLTVRLRGSTMSHYLLNLVPVLRIYSILMRIRIWICSGFIFSVLKEPKLFLRCCIF